MKLVMSLGTPSSWKLVKHSWALNAKGSKGGMSLSCNGSGNLRRLPGRSVCCWLPRMTWKTEGTSQPRKHKALLSTFGLGWLRVSLSEYRLLYGRMRTIGLRKWIQLEDEESGKMLTMHVQFHTMESVSSCCHWLWRPYLSASSFFLSSPRDKVPRVLIWKDLVPCSSGTGSPFGFWGWVKCWMLTTWLPLAFPHSRNPRSQSLCLEHVPVFVWETGVALSAPQISWLPAVIGGWILSLSVPYQS